MRRRFVRRGATMVTYCVMVGVVVLAIVVSVALLGQRTNEKLHEGGKDLHNPSEFVKQFGKD